jgi:hypothetical protein
MRKNRIFFCISEQSDESIRSDTSSQSNATCWKCPNCGTSSETNVTTDETRERSQEHHEDSSSVSHIQTSAYNSVNPPPRTEHCFHHSTSQNVSSTDRTNSYERQSSLPTSQSEYKKPSGSPIKDASTASDNQTRVKTTKSIISAVLPSSAPDSDSSITSEIGTYRSKSSSDCITHHICFRKVLRII